MIFLACTEKIFDLLFGIVTKVLDGRANFLTVFRHAKELCVEMLKVETKVNLVLAEES